MDVPTIAVQETAGRKTRADISPKKLELEIKDVAGSWKVLGVQLHIDMGELKRIEKEKLGRAPPEECFQSVLQWWLDNATEANKRWKLIYEALKNIGKIRLMKNLREKYPELDPVKLDAGQLSNELFDATPDWFDFGECLEVPEARLKMMENMRGVGPCLNAVIKLWLEGSVDEEPYWEDLVDALKRVGNARLARHIQQKYLQTSGAAVATELVPTIDPDANVDNKGLDEVNHLMEVLEVVMDEPKWYDLGLCLGIPGPKLEEIKMSNKGEVPECRKYTMMAWLQSDNATWQNLCRALRQPLVGNNKLADKIGHKYRMH